MKVVKFLWKSILIIDADFGLMGKVIAVLSGKGGVGKTTIAANLAVVLAKMGKKVLAVDANLTSSGLTTHFGKYYFPTNLNQALRGERDLFDCMYSHPEIGNLHIVPSSTSLRETMSDPFKLKPYLSVLRTYYDFIIVDAAPTLGAEAKAVIDACDEVILVTEPAKPSVLEMLKTYKYMKIKGKKLDLVVLNKVRKNAEEIKRIISDYIRTEIIEVKFDKRVRECVNRDELYVLRYPYSSFSFSIYRIAARVMGKVWKAGVLDKLRGALSWAR